MEARTKAKMTAKQTQVLEAGMRILSFWRGWSPGQPS